MATTKPQATASATTAATRELSASGITPEKYAADISALTKLVQERDAYIDTLGKQKTSIANRVAELESTLDASRTTLQQSRTEVQQLKDKAAGHQVTIAQKDKQISDLQKSITLLQQEQTSDTELRAEIEKVRIRANAVEAELDAKNLAMGKLRADFESVSAEKDTLVTDRENVSALMLQIQQEKNRLAQEFEVLNQKVKASFQPEDLASYLTSTVDSFNASVNTATEGVNYVIGNLDIELKATVGKSDTNTVILSTPDLSAGEKDALSTIKMSIRAIPRE